MMSKMIPYLAIAGLLICSAFFSSSEMALSSANRRRLKKKAEKGALRDKLAFKVYENYDKALSTILIWNNMVNNAASSIMTVIVLGFFVNNVTLIATAIMTILVLVFGEVVPKIVANNDADHYVTLIAIPLRLMMIISAPLVWVSVKFVNAITKLIKKDGPRDSSVTEEELVSMIETIEDEGVIDEGYSDLLQSAIEFSDLIAKEILTPRVDMLTIDIDDELTEIMAELKDCPYSRIPVYKDTVDNIIGILYINEFLSAVINEQQVDINQMLVEPYFINETMKLPDILMSLRRKHMHMAIVLDEYGGTMGMVTMEDILEQIVGEIWDETDEIVNDIVQVEDNVFEVNGEMSIDEFFDYFDLNDHDLNSEYVTVGGWISELLDDIPELNDQVEVQNLTIKVIELDDIRASKLLVVKQEPEKDEHEETKP